jgi:hypothetical protein
MNAMIGVIMAFASMNRRDHIPGPARGSDNATNNVDMPIET